MTRDKGHNVPDQHDPGCLMMSLPLTFKGLCKNSCLVSLDIENNRDSL